MEENIVYAGTVYSRKVDDDLFHVVTHATTLRGWLFGGTITTLCGREIGNATKPMPRYWGNGGGHRVCTACARLSKEK